MKHTLIALAVLGTLAGSAAAQSTVTVYGKLDLGLGKAIGSADKTLLDASGSRLGFRGQEDLGAGLSAQFTIEHRFDPAAGTGYAQGANAAAQGRFWNGVSSVGLKSPYGTLTLGRQYTPSYTLVQNQIDPFGGDTVAQLRETGLRADGLYATRVASAVRYDITMAGFSAGLLVGAANENGKTERPLALGLAYAAGPLYLGFGYEITGAKASDKAAIWNLGGRYRLDLLELAAGYAHGTDKNGVGSKGYLLGATVPLASGEVKLGYARQTKDGVGATSAKFGLGYHHKLSARTKLYVDFGRDSEAVQQKNGYDLGLQHNF